jgi:hypothetical protein
MGRGTAHLAKRCASWAAASVFPCHSIICPRCSYSSSGNVKRRWDLKAVFANSEVYRVAIALYQLLVTAFLDLHR